MLVQSASFSDMKHVFFLQLRDSSILCERHQGMHVATVQGKSTIVKSHAVEEEALKEKLNNWPALCDAKETCAFHSFSGRPLDKSLADIAMRGVKGMRQYFEFGLGTSCKEHTVSVFPKGATKVQIRKQIEEALTELKECHGECIANQYRYS